VAPAITSSTVFALVRVDKAVMKQDVEMTMTANLALWPLIELQMITGANKSPTTRGMITIRDISVINGLLNMWTCGSLETLTSFVVF